MPPDSAAPTPLRFHAGLAGALAPFALFLGGVAWLGLSGAPDERGFWPVLLGALALGLLLARDRRRFSEVAVEGMSRPLVALMLLAWLLAGVLGSLLRAAGFVEALAGVAGGAGLTGGAYVAATFLACCLVSTATGTSLGTVLVAGPILYPAGGPLAADPAWLIGAVLAGATFGDNISPVSDTTIASAGTQAADLGGVVRSRIKYALPAAGVAVAVYAVLGAGAAPEGAPAPRAEWSPAALGMAVAPAVVLALLLRGRHLVEGLLIGDLVAALAGLALGRLRPGDLLHVDPEAFGARGLVVEGMERAVGISVFTLLLVALVATLEATGVVERLVEAVRHRARSPGQAEAWIVLAVSGAVLLTTHSVVAILAVGELAREIGAGFGIGGYRRANLLDMTVCVWPFLLPWFIPTILASAATADALALGMPRVSPLDAGLHNVYSWALGAAVVAAVWTGWGRAEGGEKNPGVRPTARVP